MEIRPHTAADIPAIARLFFNTIRRVNSRDYTPAQIQAWAPTIYNNEYWTQRFLKRRALVAEDGGIILGFAEYEPDGHIDCFYVHHEHQRRGVGMTLMQRIESDLQQLNVHRLHAEVSITARPFFAGRGFAVVEERNAVYQDVLIKLYLMEKYI
jgi:putative acetyltransferase